MTTSRADVALARLVAIDGGVTAAAGFRSAAVSAGIKKKAGALDLSIIAARGPVAAAGIFTTNLAQAAPVLVSRRHLEDTAGYAAAVVVTVAGSQDEVKDVEVFQPFHIAGTQRIALNIFFRQAQ